MSSSNGAEGDAVSAATAAVATTTTNSNGGTDESQAPVAPQAFGGAGAPPVFPIIFSFHSFIFFPVLVSPNVPLCRNRTYRHGGPGTEGSTRQP